MPRRVQHEGLRKANVTVCIPKYLKEALDKGGNKSEIVTQILEENSDRILCGDVNTAVQYKRDSIRQRVMDELKLHQDLMKYDITPSPDLTRLLNELGSIQETVDRMTKDTGDMITNARGIKRELRNTIREQISKVIEESYDGGEAI